MAEIKLDDDSKQEIVIKLQQYFREQLNEEIGGFDAEFLVDFFSENAGAFYYNQGLADALAAFQSKIDECADIVYQLEQSID